MNLLDKVGLKITNAVGTMVCAIVFACIALISLPAAIKTHNLIVIVGWIAQTFLQLVLLSIIMVGQRLQDSKSAQRHKELHQKLDENHQEHMQHIMKIHLNLGQRGK